MELGKKQAVTRNLWIATCSINRQRKAQADPGEPNWLVAGHPGRANTYDLLSQSYSWNQMRKDVDCYIWNCHTCQRSKATHGKTHGLLRPLEILEQPWKDLSMDFVVGLPASEGFNTIWVVVNCLTKMWHLVPCTDKVDRKKLGEMYVKEVFRLHGQPETIV
jgi:hypothetical protein